MMASSEDSMRAARMSAGAALGNTRPSLADPPVSLNDPRRRTKRRRESKELAESPPSGHFDVDRLGLGGLRLRQVDVEHAVLEIRFHVVAVDMRWQAEAPHKPAIRPFGSVEAFGFLFLLLLAFTFDRQHVPIEFDLHVLFLHIRQVGLDDVLFLRFLNVNRWRPVAEEAVVIAGGC